MARRPGGRPTVPAALAAARDGGHQRLAELCQWLSIPSVSSDPGCRGAMARAAAWLARWLRSRGAEVWRLPTTADRDVVVGLFAGDAGAPLVLVYGHYDVQPAGPGWTTAPFRPVVVDGELQGRGSADDKGQLFVHLAAIDAWLRAGGLPVSVLVVAEGAEEVGSPRFAEALDGLARRWRPDVVIVSDTERADRDAPSVTVSQRGMVRARLQIDVGGGPAHAGRLGGAVVDPAVLLSAAVLELSRALGRLEAPEPPVPAEVSIRRRSDRQIRRAAGGRLTWQGNLDRRVTSRTTLSVLRLDTGGRVGGRGVGGSAAAAIPSIAEAELDVRMPPSISDQLVTRTMYQVVNRRTHVCAAHRLSILSSSPGLVALPTRPVRQVVDRASRSGFGRPPVFLRSGGTIPAVGVLSAVFGLSPVLWGLAPPGSRSHGPDEFMDLESWHRGVHASIVLIAGLARARSLDTA